MPLVTSGRSAPGNLGRRRAFATGESRRIETTKRNLFLAGAVACGFAMLATAPAAARAICDAYGDNCYNTSGRPIYQPRYGYGYAPRPYWAYHRRRHRHYDGDDEY